MVTRKPPYHAKLSSLAFYSFWCAVLILPAAASFYEPARETLDNIKSPLVLEGDNPLFVSGVRGVNPTHSMLPTILSAVDIALYEDIFRAQKSHDWESADVSITKLSNPLLMGHVLADRYLSRRYAVSSEALAKWLNEYSDHPQAADIYTMAMIKNPSLRHEVPTVRRQATLVGYGDDNGLVNAPENTPYMQLWNAGIAAWKAGHKEQAARYFAGMGEYQSQMSPWTKSAAAYWAYRSYNAIGKRSEASTYLKIAADYPRSFYGILARKQLKMPLELDYKPVELTDSNVLEMVGDQGIRRVVALAQAGMTELAEKELRSRFPQADDNEKPRLLALAHELGLASVQISMAKHLRSSEHELDFARYPHPNWRPEGGFRVDPLLIYSLMRQESGFRPSAVSSGGALGLMQLMPQTASFMQKKMGDGGLVASNSSVSEPIANITLGQSYVEHLLTNDLVEGNLFYMLAAYNAGPGRLQDWKARLVDKRDPLLFVESIPFSQTRHYVMQVMTNYWIYSELDGESNPSIHAVIQGRWPSYEQYDGPLAAKTVVATNPGA